VVHAGQLIAGTKKHFSNVSSLTFGSGTFTPDQIESSLQTLVDLRTAVDAAKAATKAKLAAEQAAATPARSLMAAYVVFVKATFSKSPDILADFGLKPKKVTTPLTVEKKAAAAAKRKATRAARHTMGKNQKKDVKGAVSAALVVTPLDGSKPAVVSAAAPAASGEPPTGGSTPHAG